MPRLRFLFLAAAALLALSGCGIYQVVTLYAPQSGGASAAGGPFRIHVTDVVAVDAFRGFELYYKFYAQGQTITGGDDNLTTLALLQSRGFRRVSSADEVIDNIDRPLIVVPMADRVPGSGPTYDLQVDFSNVLSGIEPRVVPPGAGLLPDDIQPVTIRRAVADERIGAEDAFKPFTAFSQTDADISDAIWGGRIGGSELPVMLLLYVLSYGKDETFQDVYSRPEYLGNILVNLPIGS